MFLCERCHAKSTCRSEVHLDIVRRSCQVCGMTSVCFSCNPIETIERRSVHGTPAMYRNARQLPPYRNIDI